MPASTTQLLRAIRTLFAGVGRELLGKLSLDSIAEGGTGIPDLTHWAQAGVAIVKPALLGYWHAGMVRELGRLRKYEVRNITEGLRTFRQPLVKGVMYAESRERSTTLEVRGMQQDDQHEYHARLGDAMPQRGETPVAKASWGYGVRGEPVTGTSSYTETTAGDRQGVLANPSHTSTKHPGWPLPLSLPLPLSPASALLVTKAARAGKLGKNPNPKPNAKRLSTVFDLYNPAVVAAVDSLALKFCQETLDTVVKDLDTSLEDLRTALKENVQRGPATLWLQRKVRQIFNDPYRAARIAATEGARTQHLGSMYGAKDLGVTTKTWLSTAGCCELCKDLDGKTVDLDEPYLVQGRGPYARIMCPPAHPWCGCDQTLEM